MRYLLFFFFVMVSSFAFALGNHPESSLCSPEKPYQAICTHSLHSLEGWYGQCYATQEEAQQEADKHAAQEHQGNSRWTGIKKAKFNNGAGY
ncbi:MAG: hypothetical protein L0Z73_18520 [Gammaproteobacteria bacterium]|nr:hypothetical protein [Gammaproteobacteria bacterium]